MATPRAGCGQGNRRTLVGSQACTPDNFGPPSNASPPLISMPPRALAAKTQFPPSPSTSWDAELRVSVQKDRVGWAGTVQGW